MKKLTTLFLSVISTALMAQIPNASFENWTSNDPNGWTDGNSILPGTTTKSSTAQAGSFACQLNGVGGAGGFVTTGTFSGTVYFAQAGNPAAVNGYYKLNDANGSDAINVIVATKCASGSANGTNTFATTNSTLVYKAFSLCITSGGCTTDSATITVQLNSSGAVSSSSYAVIDNLSIGACNPAGLDEVNGQVKLEAAYPNPASTFCNIIYSIPTDATVNVSLYDISGRKVSTLLDDTKQTYGRYKLPVDVSNLTNGIYIYRVTVDGQSYAQKLTVVR